jgi:hypothetical protein
VIRFRYPAARRGCVGAGGPESTAVDEAYARVGRIPATDDIGSSIGDYLSGLSPADRLAVARAAASLGTFAARGGGTSMDIVTSFGVRNDSESNGCLSDD